MARIAIVGAGALGCFYGAQLALAGHEVRLLARRDADALRRHGLRLRQTPTDQVAGTARGELSLPVDVRTDPRELAGVDWALVTLKTTALAHAPELLAPAVAAGARVVVLCNGLDVEERLAPPLPRARLFGMLCFVCVNRREDAVIEHLAHGRVEIGHVDDDARLLEPLGALIDGAGIRCDRAACLREARWRKLAWNIPFNGLGAVSAPDGVDTAAILADPTLRAEAERLMRETVAIARSDLAGRGTPVVIDADELVAELFARTEQMGRYRTSTVLDLQAGRPLEVESMFAAPLARAEALGVPTPALKRLVERLVPST